METVANITSAASRAIWGGGEETKQDPNKTEPISGELGNVKAGEPYDKGNVEPDAEKPAPISNIDGASDDRLVSPKNTTESPSLKQTSAQTSEQHPAEHQGAGRPEEKVNSEEHARIVEAKKEAEEAASTSVSGPGPKTLDGKTTESQSGVSSAGDQDDGPQKESHGEGTGEQYVVSSGIKAEGGDFDASKPGAGKEADRILEEKGVHHDPKPVAEESAKTTGEESKNAKSSPSKEKVSLKDKIKAKLHKNKDKE